MRMSPAARRHLVHPGLILGGIFCLCAAVSIGLQHINTIREVKDVSVPLVAQLPHLERRLHVLKEQVELSELQAAVRIGSEHERLQAYVLPKQLQTDRLIALLDVLGIFYTERNQLASLTELSVGEGRSATEDIAIQTVRFGAVVHEDALQDILDLVRLSGVLTVSDALGPDNQQLLLTSTEQENPAGVVPLEQFLSTDLLDYARDPRAKERQLTRSFTTTNFEATLESATAVSHLVNARRVLGGHLGTVLKQQQLWPLPLMRLHRIHVQPGTAPGWYRVGLVLDVHLSS